MRTYYFLISIGELCKFLWQDDFKKGSPGWKRWRRYVVMEWREIRNELCHNPYKSLWKPSDCYPLTGPDRKNLITLVKEMATKDELDEICLYLTRDFKESN